MTTVQTTERAQAAYEDELHTLSTASVNVSFNAFRDVPWDDPACTAHLDDPRWNLPEADLIGGTTWYQSLPVDRRIEIGRHRLAAITKTGSQFEQLLLLGGTQSLMHVPNGDPEFRYFMHELTEETHHIQMFQEFTNRVCPEVSGVPRWLLHLFPLVSVIGRFFPAPFFAIILAGEEPIDHAQKDMLRSGGVHPLMDRIMAIHVAEEARHIGFAHAWLHHHTPRLGPIRRFVIALLVPFMMRLGAGAIIKPSHRDRKMMGIPRKVMREAWYHGPQAAASRQNLFADVRMLFDELGMRGSSVRWAWRLAGIDGRPSRFRAEPAR